jgi:hypothetical protein
MQRAITKFSPTATSNMVQAIKTAILINASLYGLFCNQFLLGISGYHLPLSLKLSACLFRLFRISADGYYAGTFFDPRPSVPPIITILLFKSQCFAMLIKKNTAFEIRRPQFQLQFNK